MTQFILLHRNKDPEWVQVSHILSIKPYHYMRAEQKDIVIEGTEIRFICGWVDYDEPPDVVLKKIEDAWAQRKIPREPEKEKEAIKAPIPEAVIYNINKELDNRIVLAYNKPVIDGGINGVMLDLKKRQKKIKTDVATDKHRNKKRFKRPEKIGQEGSTS